MDFSYGAYDNMLSILEQHGYTFTDYHHIDKIDKACILRHDIDMSLEKAVSFARFEASRTPPVSSTFYALLRSDFYNVASERSVRALREIFGLGHQVGLHFDEAAADDKDRRDIRKAVERDAHVLSELIGIPIRSVSMHRPSQKTLEADYEFAGLVNTYGSEFFKRTKYLSDSRRNWREDPIQAITGNTYPKLQIVTHPIWYDDVDRNARSTLIQFMKAATMSRYTIMSENIRTLSEFISEEDL